MKSLIFIVLSCLAAANCQVVNWGPCPKVTTMSPFDMQMFSGNWYELKKLNLDPAEKCVVHRFDATNSSYGVDRMTGSEKRPTIMVTMEMSDPNVAMFNAYFPGGIFRLPLTYRILDTDYTTYAVMFSCGEIFGLSNFREIWGLSRDRVGSELVDQAIQKVLVDNKLDGISGFTATNQRDCAN